MAATQGRQIEERALIEVCALLGTGCAGAIADRASASIQTAMAISVPSTAALEEMRLPQTTVYEAATFYAHFDVVKEGEAPPPPLTVRGVTA